MERATRSLLQLGSWQQCGLVALRAAMCGDVLSLVSAGGFEQISSLRSYSTEPVRPSPKIFAACVLERLPILKSPPPEWEAEYKAWSQMRKAREGMIKQYPKLDRKQRSQEDGDQSQLNLVPAVTKADQKGVASTMKRRLADKLVLLVKARQDPAAAAASSAAAALQGPGVWTFPWTAHKDGETIRDAAERALRETIGPSQVYFVGNGPMAHLNLRSSSSEEQLPLPESTSEASDVTTTTTASGSVEPPAQQEESTTAASDVTTTTATTAASSSSRPPEKQPPEGCLFFHLATVVNDPWDVSVSDAVAADHAWVSRDELPQYIKDSRLLALAHRML